VGIAQAQAAVYFDGGFASASNIQATYGSALTPGSKLIAFFNCAGNKTATFPAGNTTAITDTAGNTWTVVTSHYDATTDYTDLIAYADNSSSASSVVVTANLGVATIFRTAGLCEWLGLATGAADKLTTGTSAAAGTTVSDAAMVTTAADLVISGDGSDGATITAGAGFTLLGFNAGSSAGWEYLIQVAAGSVTATFTHGTSRAGNLVSAAFAPAAGGGVVSEYAAPWRQRPPAASPQPHRPGPPRPVSRRRPPLPRWSATSPTPSRSATPPAPTSPSPALSPRPSPPPTPPPARSPWLAPRPTR
jgi:hypothetical protein